MVSIINWRGLILYSLIGLASLSVPTPVFAQSQDHTSKPIIVFAASSLTTALKEHASKWANEQGKPKPRLSFGASASMARQIQAGAPADIYISANPKWTALLETNDTVQKQVDTVSNQLVLVAPIGDKPLLPFTADTAGFDRLLQGRRIAVADPRTAPAGAYALNFLQKTGLWESIKNRIAYAHNVRQALRLAEQGGLPAFVYNSDATASRQVEILYQVPKSLSGDILYQTALLKSASQDAANFFGYLQTEAATDIWEKHGFHKIASN